MRKAILVVSCGAFLLAAAAGCGGEDDEGAAPTAPATTETTTASTETTPTATETAAMGDAEAGKAVFASAGCAGCHTLSAAGSNGTIGPRLDGADLTFDRVKTQVTNGGGAMPSFGDSLTQQQIEDVAAFVSQASSS